VSSERGGLQDLYKGVLFYVLASSNFLSSVFIVSIKKLSVLLGFSQNVPLLAPLPLTGKQIKDAGFGQLPFCNGRTAGETLWR
jgi:hypothetical protein